MNIKKTTILATALFISTVSFAQEKSNAVDFKKYYQVVNTGSKEDKIKLHQEIITLSKGLKNEKDLIECSNVLYRLGNEEGADSLRTAIIKKFPKGSQARNKYVSDVFYKTDGASAKEKIYKNIIKTWPVANFKGDELSYDYVLGSLAGSFAKEGNTTKTISYLEQMQERFWRGNGYLPAANTLLAAGDTITAVKLYKVAKDDAYYYISLPKEQQDNKSGFASMGYAPAVSALVKIAVAKGDYQGALNQIEEALAIAPQQYSSLAPVYYQTLSKLGRKLEAYNIVSKLYSDGNLDIEAELKKLYDEINGSSQGYDTYIASLKDGVIKNIKSHIATLETYKDAPDFELLNLKGEKVSLASLKGKVVVLDFWATWCQPCVRSFPGMKAAQELYVNDKDVQFLFVNTWERDKNYKQNVANFIEKNNYPFEVLFDDQKDPESGKVLAGKFGVNGIPSKFILDKEGKIRYAITGSGSNVEYIKLEMTEFIEAAKKPKNK